MNQVPRMDRMFDSALVEPTAEVSEQGEDQHPSRHGLPWLDGDHKSVGVDTSRKHLNRIYVHCMRDRQVHSFR